MPSLADMNCLSLSSNDWSPEGGGVVFWAPRGEKLRRGAYQQVSGLCRTVRGPSMSDHAGKIQVLGVQEVKGEKVFVLRFIQGRNPKWVHIPFFTEYDPKATWFDQLKPAFGEEKFFFDHDRHKLIETKPFLFE